MDLFKFKESNSTVIAENKTTDVLQLIMVGGKRTGVIQCFNDGSEASSGTVTLQGSLTGGANEFSTIATISNPGADSTNHTVITLFPYMKAVTSNTANTEWQITIGV